MQKLGSCDDRISEAIAFTLNKNKPKPKPVFVVRKIEGEDNEELCDNIWEAFNTEAKLYVLRQAGYELN